VETKKPPPVVEDTPPPPPPIDDTKPAASGGGLKTAGFVTIGVGVVALGVGSYLGLSAKSLDKDAEALCTPRGCTPEGKTLNDDARSRGNLATVVFTIGAVAAVGGLVMVLVAPSSSNKTSASLTPWVAHTGGGLGLSGSF
jgi:serine/threonine-protein kinase